jgi:hypothetical protein
MITGRAKSFERIKDLIKGKKINIVETGSVRGLEEHSRMGDGWSTYHWLEHANNTESNVWTVDIHQHAINLTNSLKSDYFPNVKTFTAVTSDSLQFLQDFDQPIDLLFLDSYDYCGPEENIIKCHQHSLSELKFAWNKLSPDCFILIDDVFNESWDGKGKLSIPYLLENGFELVYYLDSQACFRRCA